MSWQTEMTPILRVMINDNVTPYKNSDASLQNTIVVAARLVVAQLEFLYTFAPVITSSAATITPDPTDSASRDENFLNLVCTYAACMIDRGAASKAAGQAIRVKDGKSEIDLRESYKAYISLMKFGWCAVYDQMMEDYILSASGGAGTYGAVVMGPFRVYDIGATGYGPGTLLRRD